MSKEKSFNGPKDIKSKAVEFLKRTTTISIHMPKNLLLKNEIIEEMKSILDKDIQEQIKELSGKTPFLLILGDDDRAKLAANYAFCDRDIDHSDIRSCLTKFKYIDCYRKDFGITFWDIRNEIRYGLASGYTIFLRNLKSRDNKECVQLAKDMIDFTAKQQKYNTELLIASTESISNLPDYLICQFEIIEIDPQPGLPGIHYN